MRGVRARPGGGVRVRLSEPEWQLLQSLADELRPVLTGEHDEGDPQMHARLFPPASADPVVDAEYRLLMGDTLESERVAALERFTETLRARGERGSLELAAEDAQAWLTVVNDARLVLGVLLGVKDEQDWQHLSDRERPAVVFAYLAGLEEELVAALSAGLDAAG